MRDGPVESGAMPDGVAASIGPVAMGDGAATSVLDPIKRFFAWWWRAATEPERDPDANRVSKDW